MATALPRFAVLASVSRSPHDHNCLGSVTYCARSAHDVFFRRWSRGHRETQVTPLSDVCVLVRCIWNPGSCLSLVLYGSELRLAAASKLRRSALTPSRKRLIRG